MNFFQWVERKYFGLVTYGLVLYMFALTPRLSQRDLLLAIVKEVRAIFRKGSTLRSLFGLEVRRSLTFFVSMRMIKEETASYGYISPLLFQIGLRQ